MWLQSSAVQLLTKILLCALLCSGQEASEQQDRSQRIFPPAASEAFTRQPWLFGATQAAVVASSSPPMQVREFVLESNVFPEQTKQLLVAASEGMASRLRKKGQGRAASSILETAEKLLKEKGSLLISKYYA